MSRAFRREARRRGARSSCRGPVGDHDRPVARAARVAGRAARLARAGRAARRARKAFGAFVAAAPGRAASWSRSPRRGSSPGASAGTGAAALRPGHRRRAGLRPRRRRCCARRGRSPRSPASGRSRRQARKVAELLGDPRAAGSSPSRCPRRCRSTRRSSSATRLAGAVGLGLDAVVVNGVYPERFSNAEATRMREWPRATASIRRRSVAALAAPRRSTSAPVPSARTCGACARTRARGAGRCRSCSCPRSAWTSTSGGGGAGAEGPLPTPVVPRWRYEAMSTALGRRAPGRRACVGGTERHRCGPSRPGRLGWRAAAPGPTTSGAPTTLPAGVDVRQPPPGRPSSPPPPSASAVHRPPQSQLAQPLVARPAPPPPPPPPPDPPHPWHTPHPTCPLPSLSPPPSPVTRQRRAPRGRGGRRARRPAAETQAAKRVTRRPAPVSRSDLRAVCAAAAKRAGHRHRQKDAPSRPPPPSSLCSPSPSSRPGSRAGADQVSEPDRLAVGLPTLPPRSSPLPPSRPPYPLGDPPPCQPPTIPRGRRGPALPFSAPSTEPLDGVVDVGGRRYTAGAPPAGPAERCPATRAARPRQPRAPPRIGQQRRRRRGPPRSAARSTSTSKPRARPRAHLLGQAVVARTEGPRELNRQRQRLVAERPGVAGPRASARPRCRRARSASTPASPRRAASLRGPSPSLMRCGVRRAARSARSGRRHGSRRRRPAPLARRGPRRPPDRRARAPRRAPATAAAAPLAAVELAAVPAVARRAGSIRRMPPTEPEPAADDGRRHRPAETPWSAPGGHVRARCSAPEPLPSARAHRPPAVAALPGPSITASVASLIARSRPRARAAPWRRLRVRRTLAAHRARRSTAVPDARAGERWRSEVRDEEMGVRRGAGPVRRRLIPRLRARLAPRRAGRSTQGAPARRRREPHRGRRGDHPGARRRPTPDGCARIADDGGAAAEPLTPLPNPRASTPARSRCSRRRAAARPRPRSSGPARASRSTGTGSISPAARAPPPPPPPRSARTALPRPGRRDRVADGLQALAQPGRLRRRRAAGTAPTGVGQRAGDDHAAAPRPGARQRPAGPGPAPSSAGPGAGPDGGRRRQGRGSARGSSTHEAVDGQRARPYERGTGRAGRGGAAQPRWRERRLSPAAAARRGAHRPARPRDDPAVARRAPHPPPPPPTPPPSELDQRRGDGRSARSRAPAAWCPRRRGNFELAARRPAGRSLGRSRRSARARGAGFAVRREGDRCGCAAAGCSGRDDVVPVARGPRVPDRRGRAAPPAGLPRFGSWRRLRGGGAPGRARCSRCSAREVEGAPGRAAARAGRRAPRPRASAAPLRAALHPVAASSWRPVAGLAAWLLGPRWRRGRSGSRPCSGSRLAATTAPRAGALPEGRRAALARARPHDAAGPAGDGLQDHSLAENVLAAPGAGPADLPGGGGQRARRLLAPRPLAGLEDRPRSVLHELAVACRRTFSPAGPQRPGDPEAVEQGVVGPPGRRTRTDRSRCTRWPAPARARAARPSRSP